MMGWVFKALIANDRAWPRSVLVIRNNTGGSKDAKYYLPKRVCYPKLEYLDDHSELSVTTCSECHVACDDLEDCYYCPNCGAKVMVDE